METIHIIAFKNCLQPANGKDLLVSKAASLETLLSQCSDCLSDSFTQIFDENGIQLCSAEALRDGSKVYLSKGEKFSASHEGPAPKEPVLVLLGAAGVGKSAMVLRYVRKIFVPYYDPTIEDYYKHTATVNGQMHHVSILDTAGMEDYDPLITEWIDNKQAIILVFSLELSESLEKVEGYYHRIHNRYKEDSRPIVVLVGNKADLQRSVSHAQAKLLADKLKVKYFEVSAASGHGIVEMFNETVADITAKRKNRKIPWYRRCNLL